MTEAANCIHLNSHRSAWIHCQFLASPGSVTAVSNGSDMPYRSVLATLLRLPQKPSAAAVLTSLQSATSPLSDGSEPRKWQYFAAPIARILRILACAPDSPTADKVPVIDAGRFDQLNCRHPFGSQLQRAKRHPPVAERR